MGGILGKIKATVQNLSGKTDQYQEAVTVVAAEQPTSAQESLQTAPAAETPQKMVVVGRESVFSQEIIDYALEMAERMSYEIIALNTAPLSCETFKLFSSSRDKICEDFEGLSQKNVKAFQGAAEKRGLSFTHIVNFNESYEALKEIRAEIGEFEFVVSEMEEQETFSRTENSERAKREIFVYSMM
ncbi:hypothetical protein ACFL0M_04640 [Thermodesulfobacteriota bacterium]